MKVQRRALGSRYPNTLYIATPHPRNTQDAVLFGRVRTHFNVPQ